MTREVKIQKKGDGFTAETIVIQTNKPVEPQSVEAYKDLITMLQACIDANLLRSNYNCPDKVLIWLGPAGWVLETRATEDKNE